MIERSEQINELATALAKAQGEIGGAIRDSTNPHFRSSFSSLASVREAYRDQLAKFGLSVTQLPERGDTDVAVVTMLMHASGQWIACRLSAVPVKHDPQGVGSALSYLRRYSLMSVIGIAPEDDDGNAASDVGTGNRERPKARRNGAQDVPTTAQPAAPPSAPVPSSGSAPSETQGETDEQKIERWKAALLAAHTTAELKAVGAKISRERHGDAVRMALGVQYKARLAELDGKKKANVEELSSPCATCGGQGHTAIKCPNVGAAERAEALREAGEEG